ncbi:MAG TPA: HAMP domain-containing sensor histidine kinase [Afifellaceae bacterium]|nr:HAMP domain-containing sensor histidine kinase [Afifellaceae bacterium]
MVDAADQIRPDPTTTPSRAARRRLITRALLGNSRAANDPRTPLFHFEQEMVDQFAKNRLSSSIVVPVLVLIMGIAVGFVTDPLIAAAWGSLTLLSHSFVIKACRKFLQEEPGRMTLSTWRRRFVIRDTLYGLSWGIFPLLFPSDVGPELVAGLDIVRFATVIVVLSVGALLSSPIPAAAVGGTMPIAIAMAVVHMVDPTFFGVLVALCTMGAEIFFLYLTRHLYDQHAMNLGFRAEKDAIFAELEQAKAVSDEARRRAEASNMAKSQFLATMSHELRTPLNAILGFSEFMCTEMLGPIENGTYKEYLDDIHHSGEHLLKLINEILDLSRIEAGKRELNEHLISLVAITQEARGLLDLKARQRDIEIAEVYDETMPRIVVDPQAMRQVALNLLSNALKFTPPGGEIIIKVGRTQSGGQYVSVRDNGPGIAKDEIPVVLSAFGQGSVSIKNAEQGTGLGIPIVQALIHLHGGNFTLRSQIGVGTEAIATLPAKRVVSAVTEEDTGRQLAMQATSRRGGRLRRSA